MKFVNENSDIKCVRVMTGKTANSAKETVVVTFDHQIETVPPHVAARLSRQEIKELEQWLKERSKLQAVLEESSVEKTLLETLPAFLQETTSALDEINTLDFNLFKSIKLSLLKLDRRLGEFHSVTEKEILDLDAMQDNEVLKEQLDALKSKL